MQVFKAALRVFFRHKVYILTYMVALSVLAVFLGISLAGTPETDFSTERPEIAIIDRDGSELSRGLAGFLEQQANLVEIEDSRLAMQDATAQNRASYIMIIPEGFAQDFLSAARSGSSVPIIETVVSYESISANMMNVLVDEYLNIAYLYASIGTDLSQAEIVSQVRADMASETAVTLLVFGESAPVSRQWIIYMMFSSYIAMLSIIVCIGVLLSAFNRAEIRRRDLSSPVSSLSMNLQIAAACIVAALIVWVWLSFLGLLIFGNSLSGVATLVITLILVALLVFCLVALAIGFLLGQLTSSELVLNAVGNIIGLVLSFLGGVWLPLELMGDAVASVARFTPTFYFTDTINKAIVLRDFSSASITPILSNISVILLFAAAIFTVSLVAGRMRMQSATAGGNAAAARTRS
ncbi:MAG: ABC transporter permease [Eggerthellaceae bacterium]|nr:ABC transporter permease [Eggerthellaceae bacterium]